MKSIEIPVSSDKSSVQNNKKCNPQKFGTSVTGRTVSEGTQEISLDSSVVEHHMKEIAVGNNDHDARVGNGGAVVQQSQQQEEPQQDQQHQKPEQSQEQQQQQDLDSDSGYSIGSSGEDLDGPMVYTQDDLEEQEDLSPWQKRLEAFNKCRYVIGGMVNNKKVQTFIVVLIMINAIMMGIATADFVTQNPQVYNAFEATDEAFLIIFTIELAMQFIYHGWRLILDGWLVFDLFIIITSWSFHSVQIIRAFRIFRALRLVTRVKVMKNLMLALFGVIPRMVAIFILLMLIMYIFSVMFTQLFKDLYVENYLDKDYFGQMDETAFTLFQIMTMDSWANICRQVMAVPGYGWAWIPFITFVIITGFIVVNLIIAVICDAISALHDDDKAKMYGMYEDTDDSTENDESQGSRTSQEDTQEQMEILEDQIVELSRIQEQTLQTLENLTMRLQMKKMKKMKNQEINSSENSTKKNS